MRNWTGTQNTCLLQRETVNDALGVEKPVRLQRPAQCIMVSVKQGAIDIFLGSTAGSGVPDYHFGQTNAPVWVPFFGGCSEFVIVAADPNVSTIANVQFGGE